MTIDEGWNVSHLLHLLTQLSLKISASLQTSLQSTCQSPAPFYPLMWTRPRGCDSFPTWSEQCTLFQLTNKSPDLQVLIVTPAATQLAANWFSAYCLWWMTSSAKCKDGILSQVWKPWLHLEILSMKVKLTVSVTKLIMWTKLSLQLYMDQMARNRRADTPYSQSSS